MNYIQSHTQTDDAPPPHDPEGTEQGLFVIGGLAGFTVFLASLGGVYWLSQFGAWDIAKLGGLASLVLGLATIFIIGGGNLAVRIGSRRKQ